MPTNNKKKKKKMSCARSKRGWRKAAPVFAASSNRRMEFALNKSSPPSEQELNERKKKKYTQPSHENIYTPVERKEENFSSPFISRHSNTHPFFIHIALARHIIIWKRNVGAYCVRRTTRWGRGGPFSLAKFAYFCLFCVIIFDMERWRIVTGRFVVDR